MSRVRILLSRVAQSVWQTVRGAAQAGLGAERLERLVKATRLRELKTRHFRFEKTLPDGNRVLYRPQDQCAIDEIYDRRIYTRGEELKPGDLVVDLGGHIGLFTLQASSKVGGRGRVIVCEPGPDNLELLRENIARNGRRNVTLLACAVADKAGTAELFIPASADPEQNPIANTLFKTPGRRGVPVQVRTLDEIVASERVARIDLLKIDVEGAEGLILRAADRALAITCRLVMEVHAGQDGLAALVGDLEARGFACSVQRDGSSPLVEAIRR